MVGRDVLLRVEKTAAEPGEPLLEVDGLSVRDDRGIEKVRDVSFEVRARRDRRHRGRGRQRPVGADRRDHGPAEGRGGPASAISGREGSATKRRASTSRPGFGHIPEDRQHRGLVLDFSIAENIGLHDFRKPPSSRYGWLYPKRLVERARLLIKEFDVRGGDPADARERSLRREPAEGDPRPRDRPESDGADRCAAHPRARRRRDRVRPPPLDRGARRRAGRSSSSRSSWTRCSRSPTASSSSTRARSSASSRRPRRRKSSAWR